MLRIAYICADRGVPIFGHKGCSIHVQEVIRAFLQLGAEVDLFASNRDGTAPSDLWPVRVHDPLPRATGDAAAREKGALAANEVLRVRLEREGPFDLVYERYSLWSHAAMEFARDRGVPGLLEVNAPLIEEQATFRELVDRAGAETVAARVFAAASALVAVSEAIAAHLAAVGVSPERVHVIPNGVNLTRFSEHVSPSRPAAPGVFTVGFLGNLKPWHGLGILVEAFEKLDRRTTATRLLIVGDGKERESLLAEAAARGVAGDLDLTGAVEPDDVPGLLASMDVGVAPYPALTDFYFSPLKVYEYMAAGVPVIASRIGQLADLIDDGVTGLLCPPGDAGALARALDRLRQQPALRRRLKAAARAEVERRHSWDAVARRIVQVAGIEPVPGVISSTGVGVR